MFQRPLLAGASQGNLKYENLFLNLQFGLKNFFVIFTHEKVSLYLLFFEKENQKLNKTGFETKKTH